MSPPLLHAALSRHKCGAVHEISGLSDERLLREMVLGDRCVKEEKRVGGVYDNEKAMVMGLLFRMTLIGSPDETFIWRCNRVVVPGPFLRTTR